MRDRLNKSLGVDGFMAEAELSKPASFLSHPLPECSCRTSKLPDNSKLVKGKNGELLYGGEDRCPDWMVHGLAMVSARTTGSKDEEVEEGELPEDDSDVEGDSENGSRIDANRPEQDEEMDPDD